MHRLILVIFLAMLIAATANYLLGTVSLPCQTPIHYSIGEFDDRFEVTRAEALEALSDAEAIWEDAFEGEELFVYDDDAAFKVNFIYDERQAAADAAEKALSELDVRGGANEVLLELHARLVSEYETYEVSYDNMRTTYDADLATYNAEVESYNNSGGAPADVYERLEQTRVELDQRRAEINTLSDKLNSLSVRINEISSKGNELISEYNDRVNTFNDTFVHDEEFTQGDYKGRQINIYTFTSQEELVLVLGHEFGHALSLDHVDDSVSIMYYLMGEQPNPPSLSAADINEYKAVCEAGFVDKVWAMYNR